MRHSDKIKSAVLELIRLVTARGGTVEFLPPGDKGLHGTFDSNKLAICIYKERPSKLSALHVAVLAHEYRHMTQYLAMDKPDYWLFCIDAVHQYSDEDEYYLERDADRYAVEFCKERGIKAPAAFLE
jgi:hypothetical protein